MIADPSPLEGLNVGIPIITPIKGRGFINQGSLYSPPSHTPVSISFSSPSFPVSGATSSLRSGLRFYLLVVYWCFRVEGFGLRVLGFRV